MSDKAHVDALESAMRQLFQAMKRPQRWEKLTAKAGISLDRPAATILLILAARGKNGTTVHELAESLGIEMPSVTRKTQELEEEGLLTRERSQTDKRVVQVYITAHGKKIIDKLHKVQHEEVVAVLKHWSRQDRDTLTSLFSRFTNDMLEQFNR